MFENVEDQELTELTPATALPEVEDIQHQPTAPATPLVIQGMPKEFRDYHPIAGGSGKIGGALILVLSVVFLIGVAFGVYFYIVKPYLNNRDDMAQRQQPVVNQPAKSDQLNPETATVAPEQSPKEVYSQFIASLLVSSTFDQYYKVMSQFASQHALTELEADKLRFEAPSVDPNFVSDFLAKNVPDYLTGGEEVIEQIKDNQAVVMVSTDSEEVLGTIELVLADNQWKIDNTVWKYEDAIDVPVVTDLTKAKDRDNDGLTDSEETLLGSSKDSADSDSDGFGDLSEILNLYNPTGKNKLIDSPKLASYLNNNFNYSIIYPSQWQVNANTAKDSVMFRSPDGHFVQVLVQANDRGISLDNWYKDTFNVTSINNVQRLSGKGWQGIKTLDGIYLYAQGADRQQLFVFQYYPGQANIAEYINVFQAMLNSFVIQ
ncbi:MAG: hypothetical protein V1765_01960 [bacterium]